MAKIKLYRDSSAQTFVVPNYTSFHFAKTEVKFQLHRVTEFDDDGDGVADTVHETWSERIFSGSFSIQGGTVSGTVYKIVGSDLSYEGESGSLDQYFNLQIEDGFYFRDLIVLQGEGEKAWQTLLSRSDELSGVPNGYAGNDVLSGGLGSDTLRGGGGNDKLIGGPGADRLYGDEGVDTASYLSASKGVSANLKSPSLNTNDAKGDIYFSIENLFGSNFSDVLAGDDFANRISGGAGNDRIYGGAGNDTIFGGAGRDILSGGSGKDVFIFNQRLGANNIDTIDDFSVKDDTIWLDSDIFTKAGKVGDLASAAFYAGSKAHDSSDRIIYDKSNGKLWYDADGSGKSVATQFAQLDKWLPLTAHDFDIIS